jgi:hypothetical protein
MPLGAVILSLLIAVSLNAAAQTTRFDAKSGSKMRIEGTSSVHDWQVESPLIGGYLEVGPGFPVEPGQSATPGKVEAKAEAKISVRLLKSIEKDGKPYMDSMDEIMYGKLKIKEYPQIVYRLDELVLKEPAKDKNSPYLFESKGELAVAGVTNKISMPVSILPLGDNKLKISGTNVVKMTDFKIEPPAPTIALGLIKTGDEVKLIFDWMVMQKKPAVQGK